MGNPEKNHFLARNVLFVLPTSMAARGLLETPVLEVFRAQTKYIAQVLSPSNREKKKIQALGFDDVVWRSVYYPATDELNLRQRALRLCRALCLRLNGLTRSDYPSLVYRFNEINGFVGHRQKSAMSVARQTREALAGNFVDPNLGKPFATNRSLFKTLYRIYYGRWQCIPPSIASFVREAKPAAMVLWNPQNTLTKDYLVAANKFKIPIVVVITSWDMPTTKGPIGPGVQKYIVNSQAMKQELMSFHEIDADRIDVSGWPQMDVYLQTKAIGREAFMDSLNIAGNRKLVVFAANSERLGCHEPSVVEHLAGRINDGTFQHSCTLLVRPHPKDGNWKNRFGSVLGCENVLVEPPEWGRLKHLGSLMRHADVVVASQGSITMDAAALDTCIVNIGFDGGMEVPATESVRNWYRMDHYKTVLETGGVWLVDDFDELDVAVNAYLNDPGLKSIERQRLRTDQLEPMDGSASRSIVNIIADTASAHAATGVVDPIDSTVSV